MDLPGHPPVIVKPFTPVESLSSRRNQKRRQVLGVVAGLTGNALLPSLTCAREADGPSGLVPLDLQYAGYLVSGAGSTPLASARLRANSQAGRYQIELQVESFLADLTYQSQGIIDAAGLKPLQYHERRKVAFRSERKKSVVYVHTDDKKIQNTQAGNQLFVPTGAQDRLSLILQVIWLSRANSALLTDNAELSLPFARVNRVTESRWQIRGPERLAREDGDERVQRTTPMGYRVTRVADSKDTVDVSFWLSADQALQPLVLQFAENGRSLRFVHDSV